MGRRFLPALFGAERKDATLMRATAVQTFAYGRPYLSDWSFERAIKDAYERVVWVYRGVDLIAGNAAALEIQIRKGDPLKGQADTKHALLPLLNVKANMWESAEAFQYRLFSQYLLNKRGAFVEVAYNRGGDVAGLYLLPPQWTNPIPDPDLYVSGFRVQVPGGAAPVDIPAFIPPGQPGAGRPKVLWIRKPHPLDPYSGVTPLESAGLTIDMDFYARVFNRAFLQNDGRPGGVLAVKGDLDPKDAEALRRKFSQGPAGAGRTAVIEADELSWVDTSATHRDSQYIEGRNQGQQEILVALGAPLSMLGWAADRCVDEETEALTQRGWLRGDQITTEDTILSMDPADGRLKWSPVHEVYRAQRAGPMYRLKNKHADFLVTPGHNWLVSERPGQGRGPRGRNREEMGSPGRILKKVEDLSCHDVICATGLPENSNLEATYSSAFVELVGWAVTEGSYDRPAYIRISQNEGPTAERIRACLKESGALWSEGFQSDRPQMRRFYLRGEIALAVTAVSPGRVMALDFLLELTADQREQLLQTMIDADGARQESTTSWIFTQKDPAAADAFAVLANLAGYTTSTRYESAGKNGSDGRELFRHRVIVRQRKVLTVQRDTRSVEHFEGMVWCPRTDYGTFLARRMGSDGISRTVITGNTFDNADAEMLIFWRETMLSHLRIVQGGFNPLMADPVEFAQGPGGAWIPQLNTTPVPYANFIVYDTGSVAVLKRDEQNQMAADLKEVAGLTMSPDEYRIKWGRLPFDTPGSRALWALNTMVAAIPANEADKAALLPPAPPPTIVHTTGPPGSKPELGPGSAAALPAGPKPAAQKGILADLAATPIGGVMVALYPPPDVAAALSLPAGEDTADLHMTLVFLGKVGSVDPDLLRQVVASFAATMPPLEARVSGYGRFDQDAEHAIYASIDAPDLPEFRQRLVSVLNALGLQESQSHGFTPHMTLAYVGSDDPDPDMPPKLSWSFASITVAYGADQRSYRLRGENKVLVAASRPSSRWVTGGAG